MECYKLGEEIYYQTVAAGKMPQSVRDDQLSAIIPYYKNFNLQKMSDVIKIDARLVAMQLMLVPRAHGYETNPIGGFEEDQIVETFRFDKERYIPVMIVSIGKAMETGHESLHCQLKELLLSCKEA